MTCSEITRNGWYVITVSGREPILRYVVIQGQGPVFYEHHDGHDLPISCTAPPFSYADAEWFDIPEGVPACVE